MPLPSSGQISFSQLAAELGNACSNVGLRAYSACANLTSPDSIIELRGKTCTPVFGAGAWSTGGSMITASSYWSAGLGTQNAALVAGGSGYIGCTEEYNGTSWAVGNALIKARGGITGAGSQNEGLAMGGVACVGTVYEIDPDTGIGAYYDNYNDVTCTEEYNGTSWSAGGAMIFARNNLAGAGTQNAGLAMGGRIVYSQIYSCTEEYNGTSWSTGGVTITAKAWLAGAGTQNAGLSMGGYIGGGVYLSCTEEYNGTSWAAGGSLITARGFTAGAGTQNEAIIFGGYRSPGGNTGSVEEYNGTSWSACSSLLIGRQSLTGAGTQNAALAIGGSYPWGGRTEEYNKSITGKCLA